MKKKILITGGAGRLGHKIASHLQEAGFETLSLDNLSRHDDRLVQGAFIETNLLTTDMLIEILKGENIHAVIHCAGYFDPEESKKRPADYYENNFAGALSLLKAMKAADVKTLIFATSDNFGDTPLGHAQMIVRQLFVDSAIAYGLNLAILTSGNPIDYLEKVLEFNP